MIDLVRYIKENAPRLKAHLSAFGSARVSLIGDFALDEFVVGSVERISREAPVLILQHEHTQQYPGGGANTLYNLAALGAQAGAVGCVGEDEQGRALLSLLEQKGIDTRHVLRLTDRQTLTKSRISAHSRQSVNQQIVRIDRKPQRPISPQEQQLLQAEIQSVLAGTACVICSDYGDGLFSAQLIESVLQHPKVVVDTQRNLFRFRGAYAFTPNLPEAEAEAGFGVVSEGDMDSLVHCLFEKTAAQVLLITRGAQGMTLAERSPAGHITCAQLPAYNRTEVYDVTGAGDTVAATFGLALAAGASPLDAAVLGNLAAGLVVRRFGTATTTVDELCEQLDNPLY